MRSRSSRPTPLVNGGARSTILLLTESANPAFSPDGTKVAFQSSAINFVPGQRDGETDVFIKDLTTGAFPSADFTTTAATGVLANDTSPDGGLVALGIVVNGVVQTGAVRTAAGGSASVFSDGRLIYDQPFSTDAQGLVRYNGLDSFTYRVRDADGSTADATVTLTVGSGVQTTLTKGADTVVGTSGDDLINVGTQTLSLGDRIDGGGGTNHLELVGGGIFNLSVPTTLTNFRWSTLRRARPPAEQWPLPTNRLRWEAGSTLRSTSKPHPWTRLTRRRQPSPSMGG